MRDVAYIALGSNLGQREAHLRMARQALSGLFDSRLLAESEVVETAPIGPPDQPAYLNQMLAIETTMSPLALLDALQEIEQRAGRERAERWGPRTLDLDIVRFERQTCADERLTVPHPELPNRDFWRRGIEQVDARR
jgi:2-amino-4-hydroxy-6-hydroxymethyldihydropteridine diphosphokinase